MHSLIAFLIGKLLEIINGHNELYKRKKNNNNEKMNVVGYKNDKI